MQLRRVLLLFALVLGLSALVASLVPPPETENESPGGEPTTAAPAPPPEPGAGRSELRFVVDPERKKVATRSAGVGSSVAVEVAVEEPGEIEVEGLGLRASADPRAPARFTVLAQPAGTHDVLFHPLRGEPVVVGRLAFEEPDVRPRPRRP